MSDKALSRQVGGTHYSQMPMQPFHFSLHNGYDPAAHTILKYISRYPFKAGIVDLEKAIHTVEIREHFKETTRRPLHPNRSVPMGIYVVQNSEFLNEYQRAILFRLDDYLHRYNNAEHLISLIRDVIEKEKKALTLAEQST